MLIHSSSAAWEWHNKDIKELQTPSKSIPRSFCDNVFGKSNTTPDRRKSLPLDTTCALSEPCSSCLLRPLKTKSWPVEKCCQGEEMKNNWFAATSPHSKQDVHLRGMPLDCPLHSPGPVETTNQTPDKGARMDGDVKFIGDLVKYFPYTFMVQIKLTNTSIAVGDTDGTWLKNA